MALGEFSQQDLGLALQTFASGVKSMQLQSALAQANQQVQQIKQTVADENEQRQALQQVASNIVLKMTGLGAQAHEVAQVAQAVNPPSDPLELIFAKAKAKGGGAGQALTQGQIDKVQNFDTQEMQANELLSFVNEQQSLLKPVAGRIPGVNSVRELVDPRFADFKASLGRFFDAYRVMVTGAGASPGELSILRKNIPGENDTPDVFKKKMTTFIETTRKVKENYIKRLGQAGRNTGGMQEAAPDAAVPGGAPDISKYLR